MVYKRKRTYKAKRYGKRSYSRTRSRYRSRMPGKRLYRQIKTVVNRQIETKCNQGTSAAVFVNNIIAADDCYTFIPTIQHGTGQSERIGNRIKPVSLKLKMAIHCLDVKNIISNPTPTYFDIYIFKLKNKQYYTGGPSAGEMASFLQFDNAATAYTGDKLSGLRPVNDDLFTLCTKRRVCLSNMTNATTTLNIGAPVMPAKTLSFNLTKYLKKTLIYEDDNNLITNDNIYIAVGSSQMDGVSTGESVVGSYQLFGEIKYKDA